MVLTFLEVAYLWYRSVERVCPLLRLPNHLAQCCQDRCYRLVSILKQFGGNVVHCWRLSCLHAASTTSSLSTGLSASHGTLVTAEEVGVRIKFVVTQSTTVPSPPFQNSRAFRPFHCCLRGLLTHYLVLVRALRVLQASLLFPNIIPFSMLLHFSSFHSSLAAFIDFRTILLTFLYLVLLQCLYTSIVSAAVSGRTASEPRCDPRSNLLPLSPKNLFAVESSTSLLFFFKGLFVVV